MKPEEIRKAVMDLDHATGNEHERHAAELKRLRDEYRKIVRQCPHASERYVPDPSGNNDSAHICNDCGRRDDLDPHHRRPRDAAAGGDDMKPSFNPTDETVEAVVVWKTITWLFGDEP